MHDNDDVGLSAMSGDNFDSDVHVGDILCRGCLKSSSR